MPELMNPPLDWIYNNADAGETLKDERALKGVVLSRTERQLVPT
jgi:hypothetical protein